MSKINRVSRTVKFEFSAPDFVTFEANIEQGLLIVSGDGDYNIMTDLSKDTLQRLKDLCTYALKEIGE